MEYVKAIQQRYHQASKEEKGRILAEFCGTCHYNRKYAIRLLNGAPPTKKIIRRLRAPIYSNETIRVAESIWKYSGFLCGQRLKEAIPIWLPAARKRFGISPEVEQQLLSIGARQLDNRLKAKKKLWKRRFYSTTRPGSLLKRMIPIRTSNWDIRTPGFLEIDLVAHCGNSLSGTFVYTLDATDIRTGWTERVAVLGKGQHGILEGVKGIKNILPFRLKGIDSDNGDEFINYHLLRFCQDSRPKIEFTRGRPYKKNDNPHIEQKNWTHVRQVFGWDRYDSQLACDAMNDLYANELRLLQNLFQPSMKLIRKQRVGSKVNRVYDQSKTPLQRVLDSGAGNPEQMKILKQLVESIDPFDLSEQIDQKLDRIFELVAQRSGGQLPAPAVSYVQPSSYSAKSKRLNILMAQLKRPFVLAQQN
jgi:hypothetical protein